ncbi:MAG: RagB/SusD family nutrient uptake outer membrane protein [Bacteroidetes bacterium]|nr:RagB/SusD family nutrient uptake outer membrane protein [Bacteroidota bacterium]
MKRILKITFIVTALTLFFASCVKDLNTKPINPRLISPESAYSTANGYKQVLAKCYAGLSVSGQQGPSGNPDISGIDEGFGEYLRGYWYHQELTTDEAVIGWNDQTIKNFHYQTWGSGDVFIAAMYYRIFYQVSLCNEFIREAQDSKLDARGITGQDKINCQYYRAEARFLRALSYYHALDLFGNVPFVTENNEPGKFFPPQINRADLFNYIQSELLAIEPLMFGARSNEFGRADKGAVWMLLAKLYLNAEVYTGTQRFTDCITYCNNIIGAGYTLEPKYKNLFLADNNKSNEIIFPIEFDGVRTRTWGGTTFVIHAAIGGSMPPSDFGVAGGWGGTRTTKPIVKLFYPDLKNGLWHSTTPPKSTNAYPVLYCPGSYQGWNASNPNTVVASVKSDGQYEGYLNFLTGGIQFKFAANGTWDVNWGDGGNGTLKHNGDNISVADAGYYKVNADTVAMTFSILKTTWAIIGDATSGGWSNDTPMVYDTTLKAWTVTADLLGGKGLKFRANGGWDLNYGDDGTLTGILKAGGDNISIPEDGTYIITMKLGCPDYTYTIHRNSYDRRAMFWSDGQSLEINDIGMFTDGYAITKFKNITSEGVGGSDQTYCDTDFPLFRLADVYLMYAEAVLRGGGSGSTSTALDYVNALRERAYGDQAGNITLSELNLDFILDERGRELYWECQRRTDLIRYGRFSTGNYLWPWKGGVKNGISTLPFYNIFPIPSSDVSANPNLKQNPGY